ncbi:uncharacterized protein Nmag_0994 [Natrialba magadii ATCC 43099]|uniref:Uncharacterized protein n=2 Tax=Natrialba magadii TaxID=13769 RepID=D3SQU0_NATMM|nr:uncharacterized protein Nmag_0994 [Natrialba magadii ATCC 43099]ELY25235.1 hypothetical protein C500_17496 [Natrialba magadii ATCC 43099]
MSMTLIVDRSDDRSRSDLTEDEASHSEATQRERIEVTELHAAGVEEFIHDQTDVDTDQVSLEHRGARTYLVLEE